MFKVMEYLNTKIIFEVFNFKNLKYSLFCINISAIPLVAQHCIESGMLLKKGEFIYSPQNKFKMGLDENGSLFISATNQRIYVYTGKSLLDNNTICYQRFCNHWMAKWNEKYLYIDYSVLNDGKNMTVKGGTLWGLNGLMNPNLCIMGINKAYKSDGSDYIIWSTRLKATKEKVMLFLQDSGRAVIFGESGKLYWCSCSYCYNHPDGLLKDYFWNNMPPDRPYHRQDLRQCLMGMPTHQEEEEMVKTSK